MLKLQINSYGSLDKEVSLKNYLNLSQDNPKWKPSLRKFDLSRGIGMYHFKGLV